MTRERELECVISDLSAECREQRDEIASLKEQLIVAGVELSQCILDKMEQAKQLAECKKEGFIQVPISPEGQWSNDDLINIMVEAYQDNNGGYYDGMLAAYKAMVAAQKEES
jgi:hypothetical protein